MVVAVKEKEFDEKVEEKTVVNAPDITERRSPAANIFTLNVAQVSQNISPWGRNYALRDRQLRDFWHSEPWLASVVYSVSIRNASFKWEVIGSDPKQRPPRNTIRAVTNLLNNSNRGKGWIDLINKTCIDLYSQDNAAWWEIIRREDRPDSPVLNIAHLDASRIQRTGDPEFPAIYYDRYGKEIILPYWRVRSIEEFPSPLEDVYGLQYCAVSRALLAAEIIQSISVYKMEKVSGNFTRAIDVISGVTKANIDDATALAEEQNLNKGLYRYSLPVILPGIDPTASLSHVHIDLASLPDNFDEDSSLKWYVAQLAAAFGVDYQEIAPLMTGNLGSSQQSEIMHLKTRGKGPALIMSLFENTINAGLIPGNVEFRFLEQDIRSEREKAETMFTRVKARSLQIKSGELTIEAARELAVESGDVPPHLAESMGSPDNPENATDEFGPSQVAEGMETQFSRKLDKAGIKAIRKAVSTSPLDFLESYKASLGHPSATVISPVTSSEISLLRNRLLIDYAGDRMRLVPPSDYHVTLIHSPLVDEAELSAIHEYSGKYTFDFPISLTSSRLDYFDTPNGKAVVLLVDDNPSLERVQNDMVALFTKMGIPLSEFTVEWKPHITLAYLDESLDFEASKLDRISLVAHAPVFTRSDYRVVDRGL